jgi:large subunit ribosomal protein L4
MELKVINNKGADNGTVQFDESLVATKASKAVLHEVVLAYQAAQRSGTHRTLTRAEVSGGGLKPWKQKGTGRARSGSTRSPLWRHGGIIFGPVPRDYSVSIPKKKKQLAFRMAVKGLIDDNRIQVVDPIEISEAKTKHVAAVYSKWQAPTDSLFVVEKIEPILNKAARNIPNVRLIDVASLNTYDCLRARKLYVTKQALQAIVSRITANTGKAS